MMFARFFLTKKEKWDKIMELSKGDFNMKLIQEQLIELHQIMDLWISQKEELIASKEGKNARCGYNQTSDIIVSTSDEISAIDQRLRAVMEIIASAEIVAETTGDTIEIGTKFEATLKTQSGEIDVVEAILIDKRIAGEGQDTMITKDSFFGAAVKGKRVGEEYSYTTQEGKVFTGKITDIQQTDCRSLSNGCDAGGHTEAKSVTKVKK